MGSRVRTREVMSPGGAAKRSRGAAVLAAVAVLAGAGCAVPERRGEEPVPAVAAPPVPPLPPPATSRPPALPAARPPEPRPVRVRLEGIGRETVLAGEEIRAWRADGSLVADERSEVRVSAVGDRILWRPSPRPEADRQTAAAAGAGRARADEGPGKVLPSAVDVGAQPALTVGGRRLPGRARLAAAAGRLQVVAVVPLEEYVAAVVSREAGPSFAPEALAAFAIAARSYVLGAMAKPRDPAYDVTSGVEDQVFEGSDGAVGPFQAAAEATRGRVLLYGGDPAQAVYHSTCGGMTERAADAWGREVPYLRGLACDDCADSPARRWNYRMSAAEGRRVARALGVKAEGDLAIEVVGRTATGRARRIRLVSGGVSRETSASAFRQAAGYAKVKSLRMEIAPVAGGWLFSGQGYGHGVGMCQWGADGMARRRRTHREILARYYPGTRVGEANR